MYFLDVRAVDIVGLCSWGVLDTVWSTWLFGKMGGQFIRSTLASRPISQPVPQTDIVGGQYERDCGDGGNRRNNQWLHCLERLKQQPCLEAAVNVAEHWICIN
jgi:hypothetical protein